MAGSDFGFAAHKVHVHRWPPDAPEWTRGRKDEVASYNKSAEPKAVSVCGTSLQVGSYRFESIRKIGITVPPFKRQCTVIFEGRCEEFHAHVHITTRSGDYLQTFNRLMAWRETEFPDAFYAD